MLLLTLPLSGLSEGQISDISSKAGQVLDLRLGFQFVYDRETGRQTGLAFAEYPGSG